MRRNTYKDALMNSKIQYHLRELEIAKDPDDPKYVMPSFSKNDQVILDIGCGIGQTFIAANLRETINLIGIDIDFGVLSYGKKKTFEYIHFINGSGDCLPFKDNSFDFVISRVGLPYTNIPKAVIEIQRVLKDSGRMWLVLLPFSITIKHLYRSVCNLQIKDMIFRSYVIWNGLLFHFFEKQMSFPIKHRYESFQTSLSFLLIS